MNTNNKCQVFAQTLSKVVGITYTKATKLYPRGYANNSVYINATDILSAHCVHCARAEALAKYGGDD